VALLGERDVRTLLEYYKGGATRAEGERFFALCPKAVDGDSTATGKDISVGDVGF